MNCPKFLSFHLSLTFNSDQSRQFCTLAIGHYLCSISPNCQDGTAVSMDHQSSLGIGVHLACSKIPMNWLWNRLWCSLYSCLFSVSRIACNLKRKSTTQKDFKAKSYTKLKERMCRGTSHQAMVPRKRSLLLLWRKNHKVSLIRETTPVWSQFLSLLRGSFSHYHKIRDKWVLLVNFQ